MKHLILIISVIFFLGCNKNESIPNCGCKSKTIDTIPESEALIGTLRYKTQTDPNDNYYNNRFWISHEYSAGVHFLIVCNENMLSDIELEENETLQVSFAGDLKELCEKTAHLANDEYNHIVLTKIEIQ